MGGTNSKKRGLASSAGQVLATDDNERPGSNMDDVEPPNLMLQASGSVANLSEHDDSKKNKKIAKNSKSHNSRQRELEK